MTDGRPQRLLKEHFRNGRGGAYLVPVAKPYPLGIPLGSVGKREGGKQKAGG